MKKTILIFLFSILFISCNKIVDPPFGYYKQFHTLFITNNLEYTIYIDALFLPITNNTTSDGIWNGKNYVKYGETTEIKPGEKKYIMDYMIPSMIKIYKENINSEPLIFKSYAPAPESLLGYVSERYDSPFYEYTFNWLSNENIIIDKKYLVENAPFDYMPFGYDNQAPMYVYNLKMRKDMYTNFSGSAFEVGIVPNKDYTGFKR